MTLRIALQSDDGASVGLAIERRHSCVDRLLRRS
jgi:hypothetical protein